MPQEDAHYAGKIRGLRVSFNGVRIVDMERLDAPRSGITVLVGRSGSGKTTFLRALNRLNEEFAGCRTEGEVFLNLGGGLEPIYGASARPLPEIRRRVGMVFQTPNVLPISVRNNVVKPLELVARCPKTEIEERLYLALRAARLWEEVKDRLGVPAGDLSGGQQQRLCLARALALEPAILLLDEPTASLDLHAAADIEELLRSMGENYPLIMSSHSLDQALRVASRLAVLRDGAVARVFTSDDLPTRNELAEMLL